jgi:acetyl-CoA synthetase
MLARTKGRRTRPSAAQPKANNKANGREVLHGEVVYPSAKIVAEAHVHDFQAVAREAAKDLAGFWARRAAELEWYAPWKQVLDESKAPFYKWFVGGKVNIVHNCLDRHLNTPWP